MKILYFILINLLFASLTNAFQVHNHHAAIKAAKKLLNQSIPMIQDELTYMGKLAMMPDIEDSFHIIDICSLVDRMNFWLKNLPQVEVHYAVKTNHDKVISGTMAELGASFDCASIGEMRQILSLGVNPEKIIFSHPRKPIREIIFANHNKIKKMVFDSEEELKKMMTHAPDGEYILRIKTNDEHSDTPLSNKFGASMENAYKILDYALGHSAPVVGISFHVGSNSVDKEAYSKAIFDSSLLFKYAKEKWNTSLTILDIGGGWPGDNDERFVLFANTVKKGLALFPKDVRIIAEPGRFFATKTTTAALRIIGTEQLETEQGLKFAYHLSNGAFGLFSASIYFQFDAEKLAHEGWHFHPLIPKNEHDKTYPSAFWGPTCDSEDKILENIDFPPMRLNEFIYSKNVGSYTYSGETLFNQITPSRAYYVCKFIPSAL